MDGASFVNYILEQDRRTTVDENNRTLLHLACQETKSERKVEALLLYGVDVNARDVFGKTALHYACTNANLTYCKLLQEHKANMQVIDNNAQSPLHAAAQSSKSDDEIMSVCTFLFEHGCVRTEDKENHYPIYYTFKDQVVELFVEHGASYDDIQGDLYRAVKEGSVRLCKESLARGARVIPDDDQRTPLHIIVLSDFPLQKCIDICKELLRVIDIESKDKYGCTPLALCTRDEIATFLIHNHANEKNIVLPPDNRILKRAVAYFSENILRRWLKYGFDPNTLIDGATLVYYLIRALGRSNQDKVRRMLKILHQHGADVQTYSELLRQKLRKYRARPTAIMPAAKRPRRTLPLSTYYKVNVRLSF